MITDALLKMLSTLIGWMVSALPAWNIPLPTGLTTMAGYALAFDSVLPVSECFQVISFAVALLTAMHGFKWTLKVVDWIADVIP